MAAPTQRTAWDRVVAELHGNTPVLRILAVDLPGRRGKPGDLPKATSRDRAASQARQDVDALGGVDVTYTIDTCHYSMISQPHRVAQILLERCQAHAVAP